MKIVVCRGYDDVDRVMVEEAIGRIRKKPNLIFRLPAGNSPIGMYKYLVQVHKKGKADFSQLRTSDMDEYTGLTPGDSHSSIYFMHQCFLDHVDINMDNVRYPKVDAADLDAECKQYAQEIVGAGGLDVAIISVGDGGHIAFNKPGEYLPLCTHVVKVGETTRRWNAETFADCTGSVPEYAIITGMEEHTKAKKYHVVCSGTHKGKLLHKLSENKRLDPRFPVSWLRIHPDVEFIIDGTATAEIREDALEYYRGGQA